MAFVRGISDEDLLKEVRDRYESLDEEVNAIRPTWDSERKSVLQYRGRNLTGDGDTSEDDGRVKNDVRTNSTAYQACKITSAGFVDGLCPASRPWFFPDINDDAVANDQDVYSWLTRQRNRELMVVDKSGFYSCINSAFLEGVVFGTGIIYIWEDMKDVARVETDTIGEYRLAKNDKGEIDSVYRIKWMSAINMQRKFGKNNLPDEVSHELDSNNPYARFQVIQAIEPSRFFVPDDSGLEGNGYESIYFMGDGCTKDGKPLKRSHFKTKPFVVLRFTTIGDETYGQGLIKDILGEIKYLQDLAVEAAVAIETQNKPTIAAPVEMKGVDTKLGANRVIYYPSTQNAKAVAPVQETFVNLQMLDAIIQRVEGRIKEALLNNALKAITDITKEATKFEISKVYEEKMQILGGFVHEFSSKFLREIVERFWDIMDNLGLIEPAPELIRGKELTVEFTGLLVQAQKSIGTSTIEQSLQFLMQAAQVDQGLLDIADFEQYIRTYNRSISAPPMLLHSKEDIQKIRAQKAQQQDNAMLMQNADKLAKAVDVGANTQPNQNSLLGKIAQQVGPQQLQQMANSPQSL